MVPAKAACLPKDMLRGSATNSQLCWSRNKIHTMYCSYWLHGMYRSVRTLRQNPHDFILHSSTFLKVAAVPGGVSLCCRSFLGAEKSFSGWRVRHITSVCGAEAASGCTGDARHWCLARFSPERSQPKGGRCQRGCAEQGHAQAKQPRQNCSFFSLMQACTSQC